MKRQLYYLISSMFIAVLLFLEITPLTAQQGVKVRNNGGAFTHTPRVKSASRGDSDCFPSAFRTIDGTCNNSDNPDWGATDVPMARIMPARYGSSDPLNAMGGGNRPNARLISNSLHAQSGNIPSRRNISSFAFTWGQFLDHDITLTPEAEEEHIRVPLPPGEPTFQTPIPFSRSAVHAGTGVNSPREQSNLITAYIDASNVYGSDAARATWLRTNQNGKLKTSRGNLLPYNTVDGEFGSRVDPSAPSMAFPPHFPSVKIFVAGDVRANEQPGLTVLHTLFVREHNRICDQLVASGRTNDQENYQTARKYVAALMQKITYYEFLPALGVQLPNYRRHRSDVRPDIFNIFAGAAFRLGHTMVTDELLLLDNSCNSVSNAISLADAYFNPSHVAKYGIDPFLKGLSAQVEQEIDLPIVNGLRNFLFAVPGAPFAFGLDLSVANIQRGRDHGLPSYNEIRAEFLGQPITQFRDITSNVNVSSTIANLYNNNLNNIDAWVGLLAEDHLPNSSLGPTLNAILGMQFQRLRDGDYFYFEGDPAFDAQTLNNIRNDRLSSIIERNSGLSGLQDDVFFAANCGSSSNPSTSSTGTPSGTPNTPINTQCEPYITFLNTGCNTVGVYYNDNGQEAFYANIERNGFWRSQTRQGHEWIYKVGNQEIGRIRVSTCENITEIADSGGCN